VVIIRCALVGGTGPSDPLRVDLPTYSMVADDPAIRRAFVDVPDVDVPADVAAFVRANPTPTLASPLPSSFPAGLAAVWREHLARRYDLGQARWNPEVA
jgi:hypothetical protein